MDSLNGGLLKGKYKIERKIAQGGMSTIYLCSHIELGNKWIAKYIQKGYADLLYEEEILKKLNHINLPKIIDICYEDSGLYIIESYIEGISLQKKLEVMGALRLDKVIDYALQLCEVLIYLHSMKPNPIIHRDLKPSNIMVTQYDKLLLIDFGISEEQGGARTGLCAGTNAYAAPEQLTNGECIDVKVDIYSFGILLHQMIMGYLPDESRHVNQNMYTTVYDKVLGISEKCSRFLPRERYDCVEDLKEELLQVGNKLITIKENQKARSGFALKLFVLSSIINYICMLIGWMLL